MADLEFTAEFTDLQLMRRELVGVSKDAQKSAGIFEREFRKAETQLKRTAQANQQYFNSALKIGVANKSAEQSARTFEQALKKQEQAQKSAAREIDNLRSKYNPLFAASKLYETTQEEINRALAVGAINSRQAAAATEELTREFQEFQNGAAGFGNRFASATNLAGKGMNRLGVVAQQTGFQVGDFLVQIQSGANPLVAFGQQATQLAGILPLLAGSVGLAASTLLALSVGLGIGIPLVTAIGAAFMRTKKDSEDTASGIQTLDDRLKSLDSTLDEWIKTKKAAEAGLTIEELFGVQGIEEAAKAVEAAQEALQKAITAGTAATITGGVPILGITRQALKESEEARANLAAAEERLANIRARANDENQKSLDEQLNTELQKLELMRVEEVFGSNSLQLVRAKNQQDLENLESKLRQEAAVAGITEEEERALNAVIEAVRQQQQMESAIEASERQAQFLADGMDRVAERAREAARSVMGIFNALRATIAQIEAREAGVAAANRVIAGGGSETDARVVKAAATREAELKGLGVSGAELASGVALASQAERRRIAVEQQEKAFEEFFKDPSGGGSKGGSKGDKDPREFLRSLEDELRLKGLLVGVNDRQAEQIKLEDQLKKNLLEAGQQVTEADRKRIEAIVASAEALREAEEAEERRKAMIERIEQSFGDAITSMVKGTESIQDAFLKMIGTIVEELFKAAVVDPITSGVGDILGGFLGGGGGGSGRGLFQGDFTAGFAKGGAFSGGRVLPFANGGVVSSPTLFPLQGSQTGLMGEAGPEGILPLKRGRNGKLGVQADISGGENIVINQSFNFSANGDESVKRIIADEAPKISQMTMKNIVEMRQRGGTMKSVFSG